MLSTPDLEPRSLSLRLHTGPPIFLSGCNRGGTTILSELLSAHPDIQNVGRGAFNEGQYVWRQEFRDWSRHRWAVWPWRTLLRRTAADATAARADFLRAAFEQAMQGPGRLFEKTPANAMRIPFIDALYPDCSFIHLIRDGRDTTASLIARRVWTLYAPHQWVGAHRTALGDLRELDPARVTVVRFEALVAQPMETLREICLRCGLSWDAAARSGLRRVAQVRLRPPLDRWRGLTRLQRRYILAVIGELQEELGYPACR